MSKTIETSVVIIGGSIVGLATSAFLAYRKVPHILIEKHPGSGAHPRAIGFTTRTVELLRMLDADSQTQGTSFNRPPRRIQVESLAGKWDEEKHWGKKPQSPPSGAKGGPDPNTNSLSPVTGVALSQDKMEPIFRNRAVELGAEHYLGWKMTSFSQNDSGVEVTAVNKTNEEIKVQAKYLVAADGSTSSIRESLSITRHGVGTMRNISSILFRCEGIRKYLEKGFSQFEIKKDGFEAFLVSYPDGRWALMTYNQYQGRLDDTEQKDLIRRATGENIPDSEIEIVAHGAWDLTAFIADKYQSGRIFLAGDAAHTLPPTRGGYGANTGIADGHDLAWKLASVLSGESDPSLLDTYEPERRPIAITRHDQIFARPDYKEYLKTSKWQLPKGTEVIDDAAMELGQLYRSNAILGSEDPSLPAAQMPRMWEGQPGIRAPHFWVKQHGQRKSILDFFYRDWVVLSHHWAWKDAPQVAAQRCGIALSFVQIDEDKYEDEEEGRFEEEEEEGKFKEEKEGDFERLYGVGDLGAVLVRPDGYIAWMCRDLCDGTHSLLVDALSKVAHAHKKN